jgi:hypothetical protein
LLFCAITQRNNALQQSVVVSATTKGTNSKKQTNSSNKQSKETQSVNIA